MSVWEPLNGRESVPDSLKPPPGYVPELTRIQRDRIAVSAVMRRDAGLHAFGRPLSPRSVRMLGQPCPGGWESENGYNRHACRCDLCRLAHRGARLERMHRSSSLDAAEAVTVE